MLGYVAQAEEWQALLPQRQQLAPQLGQQLRRLAIADTKLGSVPQAITQLPNLEHLSLTHCSLFVSLSPTFCLGFDIAVDVAMQSKNTVTRCFEARCYERTHSIASLRHLRLSTRVIEWHCIT